MKPRDFRLCTVPDSFYVARQIIFTPCFVRVFIRKRKLEYIGSSNGTRGRILLVFLDGNCCEKHYAVWRWNKWKYFRNVCLNFRHCAQPVLMFRCRLRPDANCLSCATPWILNNAQCRTILGVNELIIKSWVGFISSST